MIFKLVLMMVEKRKCKECGKRKDWDEFVNNTEPLCVSCAEKATDYPSVDEIYPFGYGDIL